MREMGFTKLWPKLAQPQFTTFRFTRRDRDWAEGELVTIVFKPRSHDNRSVLGQGMIVRKVARQVEAVHYKGNLAPLISIAEAHTDGFDNLEAMRQWLRKGYGKRIWEETINKLTLAWTQYWLYMNVQKPHIQKEWADMLKAGALAEHPIYSGQQIVLHQLMLTAIHDEAALGSVSL